MEKPRKLGIVLLIAGFVVSGIGTLWGSSYENIILPKEGPCAYTTGIGGLIILMAGIFFLTQP